MIEDEAVTRVTRGGGNPPHPDWLSDYCAGAQVVAVDVPFGWPKPFIDALQAHEIGVAFDRDRSRYMYRYTDLWVTNQLPGLIQADAAPPRPLSVAADKLGVAAMVGTIFLDNVEDGFDLLPRSGGVSPAMIEVYPALSLWAWALPRAGYRGTDNGARAVRGSLLGKLREAFGFDASEQITATLIEVDHCFDALVAALTGQEYAHRNTFDPPDSLDHDVLRVEGWIRCPSRTLA